MIPQVLVTEHQGRQQEVGLKNPELKMKHIKSMLMIISINYYIPFSSLARLDKRYFSGHIDLNYKVDLKKYKLHLQVIT